MIIKMKKIVFATVLVLHNGVRIEQALNPWLTVYMQVDIL